MRTLVLATALALAACTMSKTTYLPDGSQGHSISCSGLANSWGSCFEKAGAICAARGYQVIGHTGDGGSFISATPSAVVGSDVINRHLFVRCQ